MTICRVTRTFDDGRVETWDCHWPQPPAEAFTIRTRHLDARQVDRGSLTIRSHGRAAIERYDHIEAVEWDETVQFLPELEPTSLPA